MKDIIFITLVGIFLYLGVSTIVNSAEIIGTYGALFAQKNQLFFGYTSFVYLFVLLLPIHILYRDTRVTLRRVEEFIAYILLYFSVLVFQALLIDGEFRGKVGADFVDFLAPFIGLLGIWIFWVITFTTSVIMILDKDISELLAYIKLNIKLPKRSVSKVEQKEKKVLKEAKTETIEENKTDYDTPSYERHEIQIDIDKKVEKPNNNIEEELVVEEVVENDKPNKIEENKEETKVVEKVEESVVELESSAIIVNELEENKLLLEQIDTGKVEKPKNFKLPDVAFFEKPKKVKATVNEAELDTKIAELIDKLAHFNIKGDVVRTYAGPVVSTFEFKPAANVKVSKILNLQDDLAMALKAQTIRIQAPIPGKDVVGIEIPNSTVETIYMREILESDLFQNSASALTIILGKDIVGKPFITDLKKLPHLLIAGTTGSGKSVGINAMILSLLYKNSPDNLKMIMIDPKMLEFSIYNDIPHLLTPVITKAKQAIVALNNMVGEMERRYKLMSENRTKNIDNYNIRVKKEGGEHFPYIVVIIDELADLMMAGGKEAEYSIARLAQMARASGIHLIVATQRPSVDVVTGLIKANLPSRISYKVGQKVDSKIILDAMGAESLLGRGDMLFTPPGMSGLVRLHAPWNSEDEIEKVVEFIKAQREPEYDRKFLEEELEGGSGSTSTDLAGQVLDEMYEDAKAIVLSDRKTSISYLQRKLQIGYNRSARIVEQLEYQGVLSSPNAKGNREIL
ncbi:MAG: DNA translocase FtsK [Helicobacteraceae bacterium]|nr:DNA translocase FtsK [Helicobacteraceae bacterium]